VAPSTLGFVLAYPDGLNKAGQILVDGVAPDGSQHTFLLTPTK